MKRLFISLVAFALVMLLAAPVALAVVPTYKWTNTDNVIVGWKNGKKDVLGEVQYSILVDGMVFFIHKQYPFELQMGDWRNGETGFITLYGESRRSNLTFGTIDIVNAGAFTEDGFYAVYTKKGAKEAAPLPDGTKVIKGAKIATMVPDGQWFRYVDAPTYTSIHVSDGTIYFVNAGKSEFRTYTPASEKKPGKAVKYIKDSFFDGGTYLFWQEQGKKKSDIISKYAFDGEVFVVPPEAEIQTLPGYLVLTFEDGTRQVIPELPEGISLEELISSLPVE